MCSQSFKKLGGKGSIVEIAKVIDNTYKKEHDIYKGLELSKGLI